MTKDTYLIFCATGPLMMSRFVCLFVLLKLRQSLITYSQQGFTRTKLGLGSVVIRQLMLNIVSKYSARARSGETLDQILLSSQTGSLQLKDTYLISEVDLFTSIRPNLPVFNFI